MRTSFARHKGNRVDPVGELGTCDEEVIAPHRQAKTCVNWRPYMPAPALARIDVLLWMAFYAIILLVVYATLAR